MNNIIDGDNLRDFLVNSNCTEECPLRKIALESDVVLHGIGHLACDIRHDNDADSTLRYYFKELVFFLSRIVLEKRNCPSPNLKNINMPITEWQAAERIVYKCLILLRKLGAWSDDRYVQDCSALNLYPTGKQYGSITVNIFLTLNWDYSCQVPNKEQTEKASKDEEEARRAKEEAAKEQRLYWKNYVLWHSFRLAWYLNVLFIKQKRRYQWMDFPKAMWEHSLPEKMEIYIRCLLDDQSFQSKRLMLRLFDNTLKNNKNELKYAAIASPEAVWQPFEHKPSPIAFIHYSLEDLRMELSRQNAAHKEQTTVFILYPIFKNEGSLDKRKLRDSSREKLRVIISAIRECHHECMLVFMFEEVKMRKEFEIGARLIAEALEVEYFCIDEKSEEAPLEIMANIAKERDVKNTSKVLEQNIQGWLGVEYEVALYGIKPGLVSGIAKMANELLNPPDTSPIGGEGLEPVTYRERPKFYQETLKAYFDLNAMFKCLKKVMVIQKDLKMPFNAVDLKPSLTCAVCGETRWPSKGVPRSWNSKSHGETLYERPHKKAENEYVWHEAHNTALFIRLVVSVVNYLKKSEKFDLNEFRKKVRALTAKLDINAKNKINGKKEHTRGKYKQKQINSRKLVADLLADAFDDTEAVDSNDKKQPSDKDA